MKIETGFFSPLAIILLHAAKTLLPHLKSLYITCHTIIDVRKFDSYFSIIKPYPIIISLPKNTTKCKSCL
jgi:hypothetical protein